MSDPVVVFWHCLSIPKSMKVADIWDNAVLQMKMWYPNFRYVIVTTQHIHDNVNSDLAPVSLNECRRWFPLVMLVPGEIWDIAMENGSSSILEGTQIYNGKIVNGNLEFQPRWSEYNADTYWAWLHEAVRNKEFRKYQYGEVDVQSWWQWATSWYR